MGIRDIPAAHAIKERQQTEPGELRLGRRARHPSNIPSLRVSLFVAALLQLRQARADLVGELLRSVAFDLGYGRRLAGRGADSLLAGQRVAQFHKLGLGLGRAGLAARVRQG